MGIPYIKFNIAKDGLQQAQADVQKIPALVVTGNTVAGKGNLGQSYQIFSLEDAANIGIDAVNNPFAYKHISAFYGYAGTGAELWVMMVPDATLYSSALDLNQQFATKLLNDAAGKVRILGVVLHTTGTETSANGLLGDLKTAVPKAEALAEDFTNRYFPVRIIVSGNNFSGTPADLFDYTTASFDKVSLLIGNTDGATDASIGLALGRIATTPVQRSIARVKDDAVEPLAAYFTNGAKTGSLANAWNAIADKGYIFFRNFAGLAGFYFSDDPTLTAKTDDFCSLARGLVMDKAQIIAYTTLVKNLNDEVPVTDNGNIHPAIIKSWQSDVETQINALMTSKGEISDVKVFIDTNQNITSSGFLAVNISILPVGYAKYITVNIGFTTQILN